MDSFRHLMLMPDSARREDMVTDLSLPLIAGHGMGALTARAVGDLCGCSRQAVQQWFGGQQELRRVVATRFAARWGRWTDVRVRVHGLHGLLPDTDEALTWSRVWLALAEHAPRDGRITELVALVAEDERSVVAHVLGCPPTSGRALRAHSLIQGLRLQLCAADTVVTVDRAGDLLEAART